MADFLTDYMLPLMLFAVVSALLLGVYAMMRGGEFARSNSNLLMRWRVGLQFGAVVLILIIAFLRGQVSY
ncbi:MAG: twin transmembrane helix small protein [Alphaproteobacteria bacterium]|nr:MAG: twin transmembrane helix small protein [Alphaproteobacteria bacterium]